jgi:hypothetical protein
MENIKKAINNQWQAMLNYGRIPCFEIEVINGDYLLVNIDYTQGDDFISFSFDDSLPVFFDSEIKKYGGEYRIMLDECFSSLDSYLQLIYDNIIEGYIIPNDLMLCEDE